MCELSGSSLPSRDLTGTGILFRSLRIEGLGNNFPSYSFPPMQTGESSPEAMRDALLAELLHWFKATFK